MKTTLQVGERVWVGGTKSGVVVFIGPTQFAAGEWVGVELDDAVGKNDGSVNGVRYFACKPLHGVFAKAAKLMKQAPTDDAPESGVASAATSQSSLNMTLDGNGVGKPETVSNSSTEAAADVTLLDSPSCDPPTFEAASVSEMPGNAVVSDELPDDSSEMPSSETQSSEVPSSKMLPPAQSDKQSRRGMIPRPMHGSTASLHRGGSVAGSTTDLATATAAAGDAGKPTIRVGDRVAVSGNKVGTARYVGSTEFAKGDWVGVELDEPLGKNDGCVQSKR